MDTKQLIQRAIDARELAYAPYSGFYVGAALETKGDAVYTGCNIENSGFSGTNCAERTAIFKAVSEGVRDFTRIAVVGGPKGPLTSRCAPCGVCRQVMAEFVDPDIFEVLLASSSDDYTTYTLAQLLPLAFRPGGDSDLIFIDMDAPGR